MFLFFVGLELKLGSFFRTWKRATCITFFETLFSGLLGVDLSSFLWSMVVHDGIKMTFRLFMVVNISFTAFLVLARILVELKMLTTELGSLPMCIATLYDGFIWILLVLLPHFSGSGIMSVWLNQIQALFVGFLVEILVPGNGPFIEGLANRLEDLIFIIILPLFFLSSGLKRNVTSISNGTSWALLALVISCACVAKIGSTIITSLIVKVHFREAVILGFLMNTK
ncbi:Cation/H(+) antiporter 19 [Platanthera guangdongensis]|uniref:Cation/H(+) antiporter 19 n=1 Tax=Platanthera guangdongensis TaxID=2320717 RepID=A0ABR2MKQ1_9ASPA